MYPPYWKQKLEAEQQKINSKENVKIMAKAKVNTEVSENTATETQETKVGFTPKSKPVAGTEKKMSALQAKIKAKTEHNKPEFLEDREKGEYEDLVGHVVTLKNFAIGNHSTLGDFVSFIIAEDTKNYYNNGGMVVVETFKKILDEIESIKDEGVLMLLTKVKGKNRRVYTNVEFYPEVATPFDSEEVGEE